MEVIFQIETVASVEPNCWRIAGRAYDNISVGDVVLIQIDPTSTSKDLISLTVTNISTYGRSVDCLDRMLTGVLTVKAQNKADLSAARNLIR